MKFWLVSVGGKIKRHSNIREYLLFFCLTVLMGWWNPRSCFVGDDCSLYSKSWGIYFYAHNWQLPQFSWFLLCHNMFVFLCVRSVKLTYHGCLLLLSLLKNSMEGLYLCLVLISIYYLTELSFVRLLIFESLFICTTALTHSIFGLQLLHGE